MTVPASVLLVCLGNICRSPTAHAVMQSGLDERGWHHIDVDSAGTGDWHIGHAPDPRTQAAAAERGYDLSVLRARQIETEDFYRFDLILAMDEQNLVDMQVLQPAGSPAELALFLAPVSGFGSAVPDPYYGGEDGFQRVLNCVEAGVAGWLNRWEKGG